jgi:RNA recognition motif-containing protein
MMDRKTGRSRGFGFVFVAREAADEALERMHGKLLDGRKISVTRAVPEQHTMPGTPANLLATGRGIRTGAPGMRMHGRAPHETWGTGRGRGRPDR